MKKTIPARLEIKPQDTWNLELLYPTPAAWEKALQKMKRDALRFSRYEKTLKEDIAYIHKAITDYLLLSRSISQLSAYAMLAYSSDLTDPAHQALYAKVQNAGTVYNRSTSFLIQEILSLSRPFLIQLAKHPLAKEYRQMIRGMVRSKPHVLSSLEEKLLAEQTEYSGGFEKSFEALLNTDIRFGSIKTPQGEVELSNSTLGILLENRSRAVRKNAFYQYYREIKNHKNVLSNLFASQVQKDCAHARIRKHRSSLHAALHGSNIPVSVYHSLIETTRKNLHLLHRYYGILKKIIPGKELAVYDLYFNFYKPPKVCLEYDAAVGMIVEALKPLGENYTDTLKAGLLEKRWVDRYESKGKRSGAFSYPVYHQSPYIMMNYKEESTDSMFTLAHEAGHSMHSYLSGQTNSYAHFHYSIFEAEIASTLNEYLLYRDILGKEESKKKKAYLLLEKIHSFTSTFFRQVMFAEFEYRIHHHCEKGTPLTPDLFIGEYQALSKDYYGKDVFLPEENGFVGLRIPHFYSSFYVYQYATGIATAYSLGKKIHAEYQGGEHPSPTAQKTLNFLKSAGSRYPLESLALAGINFTSGGIIEDALDDYASDLEELTKLILDK